MVNKPSFSPPCMTGESNTDIDERYMFAIPLELIDLLQQLLMAERAGLRVANESLRESCSDSQYKVLQTVRECEAESCKLLRQLLLDLGEEPSSEVGSFYSKAMTKDTMTARIEFIDRGRDWVYKRIEEKLKDSTSEKIKSVLQTVQELHREPILSKEFSR